MPPVGRPSRTRGVFSFEDATVPLPERIILDTSFVFEALVEGQRLHDACQDYLVRLARNETALIFSAFLEIELQEASFRYALIDRHGAKAWRSMRNDGRARPRAGRFMQSVSDAWQEVLRYVPHRVVPISDVRGQVAALMSSYGLGSYDAIHAATALHSGVNRLLAIDAGFGNVPANRLTLYVDGSRVAGCRKRRS
jgi:predicted nucleic acid-binding protein